MKKLVKILLAAFACLMLVGGAACKDGGKKKNESSESVQNSVSSEIESNEDNVSSEDMSSESREDSASSENEGSEDSSSESNHSHYFIPTTIDPTCTEVGATVYTCACGEKYSIEISATGHTESGWVTDVEPTYIDEGSKHTYCLSCNETLQTETIERLVQPLAYRVNDVGTCTITGKGGYYGNEIYIPETIDGYKVTAIGNSAFSCCSGLTSVTIGNSVTKIGNSAFSCCSGLTSVTIGSGVTTIGDSAFYRCSGLTSVTIGSGVTTIGNSAFRGCSGLTSVFIPDSVATIGYEVFSSCSGLINIAVDKNNQYYQSLDGNLYNKDVTKLIQYAIGKTDIAFTIPDSVTSIGDSAFYNCWRLTSVTIGNSVTSIGDVAFAGCIGLTNVILPNSVTLIGGMAFKDCSGLTSVTIGNGVASIGVSAFKGCSGLTNISVDKNNQYYQSIDGNLYNKDGTTLIQYAIGKTDTAFIIPDSVTAIGDEAFEGCSGLTGVIISDKVTLINYASFYNCDNLKTIYYEGTASDWADIRIGSNNTDLTYAAIYYYSETQPTEAGNYWRYVDGNVTIW